jgi:hypothetical protein
VTSVYRHVPPRQLGVAAGQSLFVWHWAQTPWSMQNGAAAGQSVFARHWTQAETVVLQSGVAPEQSAFVVHPGRQVKSFGRQMGAVVPQSEFARHWTHWPWATSQRGFGGWQSASEAHWRHCCVVGSQMGAPAPQSCALWQPTHSPVCGPDVMQMCWPGGHEPLPVHAAWQVWSPG